MDQLVELALRCRGLPLEAAAGVQIVVLVHTDQENPREVGQTEIIGSENPTFTRRVHLYYRFENPQKLQFVINQVDKATDKFMRLFAKVECSLGEVLSRGGTIELPLFTNKSNSFLLLEIHGTKFTGRAARLQFRGHNLHAPSSSCELSAYFMMFLAPEGASRVLLHKSESIADKNPVWKTFLIPSSHFTLTNASCTVELSVYNYNINQKDELIGKCTTTFDQLTRGVGAINAYKLSSQEGKRKGNASVELVNYLCVESSSFVDFIKAGTQIHFSVAVDFTASNGNPLEPTSLHYIHPHRLNPYMRAISAVASMIGKYNRHGRIATLGFGAQIPPNYENGDSRDPHVEGIDGVLKAYRSALLTVRPYAPTDYSKVIYHIYKFGAAVQRQGGNDHYFVLLIITDGCVTDAEQTVDAIVDCSDLPISVIIVGVGDQNFTPMDDLLSPMLKSSEGRLLRREIVTFVRYSDSLTDNELVAKLLLNIPRQFLSWVMMHERFAPCR